MLYDKDIREPLFMYFEELYGKMRIFEEKNMGRSRADVVMVLPDAICGIEIKSDADTYTRLDRQVLDYEQFFDYNFIVVGSTHASHIAEHVPEHWGIITVEQFETKVDFYEVRKPQHNPNMDWKHKIQILWRPELAHIQELNEMAKYRDKSKDFVAGKILEKVPEDILKVQFSDALFERDYSAIKEQILQYRAQKKGVPVSKVRVRKKYKRRKRKI